MPSLSCNECAVHIIKTLKTIIKCSIGLQHKIRKTGNRAASQGPDITSVTEAKLSKMQRYPHLLGFKVPITMCN